MNLRRRAVWVGIALLVAVVFAVPSLVSEVERRQHTWLPDHGVHWGLDLQGGLHRLYRIDAKSVLPREVRRLANLLAEQVDVGPLQFALRWDGDAPEITMCGSSAGDGLREAARRHVDALRVQKQADGCFLLRLSRKARDDLERRSVVQAIEVLQRRIDAKGVREAVIIAQGEGRVLVQIPGKVEPTQFDDLARVTFLEFKRVLDAAPHEDLVSPAARGTAEGEVAVQRTREGSVREALLVEREAIISGAHLEDARLAFDARGRAVVSFSFDREGARIFRSYTRRHVGERLAAIVDGQVITAPSIREAIGRHGQISGEFTRDEAANLALRLRAGALPVPLDLEEERFVGPSLGADSIIRGLRAIALGGLCVGVFMVVYYRTLGVFASVALAANLVIILALMSLAEATLTLPGIAGLVLTVGMAVDANIVIFERLREEIRAGLSLPAAVQAGFQRSQLTILDANLTTIFAAAVLFYFGRGPVQGFGLTLALGCLASVFCALVVTRIQVDLALVRRPSLLRF
jgi:preprotein translocase subunit SecD